MLSKDSECFMFEKDLFRLKQKWINQTMNIDSWNKLMDEGQELLDKYNIGDKAIIYYCYQEFITFVDFMRCKARNEYELAPRKKEQDKNRIKTGLKTEKGSISSPFRR